MNFLPRSRLLKRSALFMALLSSLARGQSPKATTPDPAPAIVERKLAELRHSPPELYALLYRMPKGGDLHNHLSGAVYAETFIQDAAAHALCVDNRTLSIEQPATA